MATFRVMYGIQRDGESEPHDLTEVQVEDVPTMAHAAWVAAWVAGDLTFLDCNISEVHARAADAYRVLVDVQRVS
jgi:hypothetical protein